MDARKTGLSMIAVGLIGQFLGIGLDALHHHNTSAGNDAIFDLSKFPHALFFSGMMVTALGLLTMLVGPRLYAPLPSSPGRRLAQGIVPILALATIAGCAAAANSSKLAEGANGAGGNGGNGALSQTSTTVHDMANMDHGAGGSTGGGTTVSPGGHDHGTVIVGSATGDSPCEKALPTPASPGEVGTGEAGSQATPAEGGHGARGMVKQIPLTNAQRVQLEAQMRLARSVIDKYPTVKDAEAAGYGKSTTYVPCIGAHYTNLKLVARFDPATPSELLYDGTSPDSKIVGLSYLNFSLNGPPDGFAGSNDHWHQHNTNGGLCLSGRQGVIGGESMSEADCKARGGRKASGIMKNIWMVHAWVAPGWECSWGVFAGECPELGGRLGGTAFDN
jgi:Spy/CpxP family protein refolding chaperone